MKDRFETCVAFVLLMETEYTSSGEVKVEHDPHDPGGTTKYGIDQQSHPGVDVANLTLEQAKEIYREGEWALCRCDELKAPWDMVIFDTAVNLGVARAVVLLQKTVGHPSAPLQRDGVIGPKTIAAVNNAVSGELELYLSRRSEYYKSLPKSMRDRYLKGWLNRVAALGRAAFNLQSPAAQMA